ncbi:MAG: hypothetical protein KGZ52_08500 [Xanthomonadaceae bacterium]|jgi:surfactin synthase thioesterase subunit|nr:hypothetical protein [Xanthomonadaceae bacterium]
MARGHVILSHGLQSGPDAAKVTALAEAAQALGWTHERPDYRDLDAHGPLGDVAARIARLRGRVLAAEGPLVLAGSSMGAFISGEVAQQLAEADAAPAAGVAAAPALRGLFLMAPPVRLKDAWPRPLVVPGGVPVLVVHGWEDELIPAPAVVDWCAAHKAELRLVDDTHRLAAHVEYSARAFAELLRRIGS